MTGGWTTVFEAVDAGGAAILSDGYAGIRTDFMDVEFDNYYSALECGRFVSPTSQSFAADGGSGAVAVATAAGCPWSAASNATWITIISGTVGTGTGAVSCLVSPNPRKRSRTGTLTIAGRTFQVNQSRLGRR